MSFPFNNISKILTFEIVILSNVDPLNIIFVNVIVLIIYIYHHHADFRICEGMEKLGREMVARCAGLPLAIIVLGGLLATKETLDECDIVHRNIKSHLSRGREQGKQSTVHEVLTLSYQELPYQLKPCFLYLSHFPEEFDIPAKKLVRLWMAEGFVSPKYELEGDEMLEDFAERCFVSLKVLIPINWLINPRTFM